MKAIIAAIFGLLVGISGTFLHNSYQPLGVLVSLLAVWLGARLVRNMYQSQLSSFLFAVGWVLVVIRGSTLGNGGEILIEANLYGNTLVFGGAALLMFSLLRSRN